MQPKLSQWQSLLRVWGLRHLQVAMGSLGRLVATPFASLMTSAVLAIALALPTVLHVALNNAEQVSGQWQQSAQISVFLRLDAQLTQAQQLQQALLRRSEIAEVALIDREQALAEFRELSGFGAALDYLQQNPLPYVLLVQPVLSMQQPLALQTLMQSIEQEPGVDIVQLDMQWLQRLYSIMAFMQRSVWAIGVLLAAGVLLIMVNTIRLAILNRRDEIEITKLVGGTDAFVRRPFLYTGVWYGVAGGFFACIFVYLTLWWLHGPIQRLAGLYNSGFQVQGLLLSDALSVILVGAGLGWIGAWLAVNRHLSEIQPR